MIFSFSKIVDCPHPTCNGHGYCAEGTCICKKGWKGLDCAAMDQDALQCLPDCSAHGTFDLDTQTCNCEPKWSGDDCSKGKHTFTFPTQKRVCVSEHLLIKKKSYLV